MPVFMRALRSTEVDKHGQTGLRIMLRARERQPAEQKRALIDAVENVVREEFPPSDQSDGGKVTGLFVLLTSLVESMLRDQWVTFAVASAGMGLMLWLALRSLKLALIALVPNVLPILLVMGLWGILGLKINMGAAMIAAVSMGLTIDSSMHYLVDFVRARRDGKPFSQALGEVQRSVGRAMIFTTLAVAVGFGVLCISDFIPTVYFGVLVSLTMIGGLAGNLIILPLQLCWFAQNYTPKK
jgi:predicted RND superfamily exporter protein